MKFRKKSPKQVERSPIEDETKIVVHLADYEQDGVGGTACGTEGPTVKSGDVRQVTCEECRILIPEVPETETVLNEKDVEKESLKDAATGTFFQTLMQVATEELTQAQAQIKFIEIWEPLLKDIPRIEQDELVVVVDHLAGRIRASLEPVLLQWYSAIKKVRAHEQATRNRPKT